MKKLNSTYVLVEFWEVLKSSFIRFYKGFKTFYTLRSSKYRIHVAVVRNTNSIVVNNSQTLDI